MSMLICDFHIHTTWSDGSVDLPEVVDIYGQAGFDVISITDHVYNSDSTIGSWADRLNKTIAEENFPNYMEALEREAERAMARYGMLLIPGVEITKNYLSEEESAHVLLLDLERMVAVLVALPVLAEGDRCRVEPDLRVRAPVDIRIFVDFAVPALVDQFQPLKRNLGGSDFRHRRQGAGQREEDGKKRQRPEHGITSRERLTRSLLRSIYSDDSGPG